MGQDQMSGELIVKRAGPALSVQDLGRPGYMCFGLSRGGAADRLALAEGAALLGQNTDLAALEMFGFGGEFEASEDTRIALTGAPMKASIDARPVIWNAVHMLTAGQRLTIGTPSRGVYGYLHVGGGFATKTLLDSRAYHVAAGLGEQITSGSTLPIGVDRNAGLGRVKLAVRDRFSGGKIRVSPSAQTHRFSIAERARFEATRFTRTAHGNRQGVQLAFDGAPFAAEGQLSILSEIMLPGDIQMTGNGNPFVLLPECQTTGGYPRIATIIPQDLPIMAQAAPETAVQFQFVSVQEALAALPTQSQIEAELKRHCQPLIRDPHEIHDLLSYQLISGVTAG